MIERDGPWPLHTPIARLEPVHPLLGGPVGEPRGDAGELGRFVNVYRCVDGSLRRGCVWADRRIAVAAVDPLEGEVHVETRRLAGDEWCGYELAPAEAP